MEKKYFNGYSDTELRNIYNNEYVPWTKTGILHNGELRNIFNKIEENQDYFALITTEKIFIAECAQRFVNGTKTPVKLTREPIPRNIIRDRVKEILVDHLGCDENEVTDDASLQNDLGADSLDHIEIMMKVEQEFNISILDDDADNVRTVNDIIDILCKVI